MIALLINWSSTTLPNVPTGWTSAATNAASFGTRLVTKTVVAGDAGSSVTFSPGGGGTVSYETVCIAVADPGGVTPVLANAGIDEQSVSVSTFAPTSLTTVGSQNLGMVFFATQLSGATVTITDTTGYSPIGVQTFSNDIDTTKSTAAVFTHDLTKSLLSATAYSAGTGGTSPGAGTKWTSASMYLTSAGGHTYTNYISSAFPLTMII